MWFYPPLRASDDTSRCTWSCVGVTLKVGATVEGNATILMMLRYAHLAPENACDAIAPA